jgi:hypothetical protein
MRKNLQNTDTMIIDQALFGYSDAKGHHCYIKTLDLPEDVFQQILILSDKTGPMNQTFRSYLTGFPIDKLQVYALIKTWIATNISRRGAVWSHVLFIKFKDLENIKDLSVLQQLFVKPMRNDSFIAYRDSISINYSKINRDAHCSNLKGYSDSFIKDCLFELFRASSNKLFLSSNSPNEFDTLIFALWRIQWPELRKIFTFCTGLLSVLESEKDLYDIQVVPDHLKERYRQRYQNISFIQDNSNISKPEWVDYLYNILNNNQAEKKFNDFIQYFSQNVYDRFYMSKLTRRINHIFKSNTK